MILGEFEIEIIPAGKIEAGGREIAWDKVSLYSQPWFMQAVAPGKGFYAKISLENQPEKSAFFPFCGQKLGWKWRLFQPSFCQRFQAFTIQTQEVDEIFWNAWFEFLEKKTWTGHWPFEISISGSDLSLFPERLSKKTNYIFPLLDTLDEMLTKWSKSRKNKLNQTSQLQVQSLDNEAFLSEIQAFSNDGESNWRPSEKEIKLLHQIHLSGKALSYRVVLENEAISLVLLVDWGNRLHYLLGISNATGLKYEAVAFFFKNLMVMQKESNKVIDFEGSSLPGVASFFRSMGAEEELYGLWSK